MTPCLLATVLFTLGVPFLHAAERAALVREAIIYLSPDTNSAKLGEAGRGREIILLDRSRNWLHVEALLGFAKTPDPSFVEDEEHPREEALTLSGLDEDYLVLSTIHSAKGLEWEDVHLIHASDGNIPSDMALTTSEGLEEERRLFYVALTRPRHSLSVYVPLRYYHRPRARDDGLRSHRTALGRTHGKAARHL